MGLQRDITTPSTTWTSWKSHSRKFSVHIFYHLIWNSIKVHQLLQTTSWEIRCFLRLRGVQWHVSTCIHNTGDGRGQGRTSRTCDPPHVPNAQCLLQNMAICMWKESLRSYVAKSKWTKFLTITLLGISVMPEWDTDLIPLEDDEIFIRDKGSCLWFEDQYIPEQGTSDT